MITRLNIVLAIALLLSCFWLIRTSDEARTLFGQLERARAQEHELAVDLDRLKVDRRTAATPLVVEEMVRTRLKMAATNPTVTHYVSDAPGVAHAHASGLAPSAASASASASASAQPVVAASVASAGGRP
ncbi:MAG: cell division protein FtsL [Pseudomonadota bacterium]